MGGSKWLYRIVENAIKWVKMDKISIVDLGVPPRMLPNANATHFCDIIFRHWAMFSNCPKQRISKIKNPVTLG